MEPGAGGDSCREPMDRPAAFTGRERKEIDMSKEPRYAEGVVFDVSHIPSDYVPIADLHSNNKRHHNAMVHACAANRMRRIRFRRSASDSMGFIYVHKEDAAAIIADSDASLEARKSTRTCDESSKETVSCKAVDAQQAQAAVTALCRIDNGISLMLETLERLTTAVESIATQPKTAQQELMATMSSNGFHN